MIVLDTNAWIFWVAAPERLSRKARRVIEENEGDGALVVSVVSAWEVALKCNLGKLALDQDPRTWIALASRYPGVRMEPLSLDDAVASIHLPGALHRDPADRFIVALARRLNVGLVTSDRRLRAYKHVRAIWR